MSVRHFGTGPHVQLQLLPFSCINQDMTEKSVSMHLPILPFPSATVTTGIAAKLVRVVQVLLLPLSLLENTCGFVKFHIGHVMHFICSSAKDLLVQSLLCVELPLTLVSCRKFKYSELHKLCIENRSESPRKEEKAHFGQFQKKHSSILTQLESNKII